MASLFERIVKSRGIKEGDIDSFLNPEYEKLHDPFLMPDMEAAVDRIVAARKNQESILIYGDYDIDGLTATTLMVDMLGSFGFKKIDKFIPNRFVEGYGLSIDAIEKIAGDGIDLIITVDCGSLSEAEIIRANELGIDIIVTDHHNAASKQPPAIAVINPKRADSRYPFRDLAGVGVAFKLAQALQQHLGGLDIGQEKWLLDLVALGTVCDVVPLIDENRILVYWGLKVLAKTRRVGLIELMKSSKVDIDKLNSRSLGFGLGPRMNAAGRLETADHALDLLMAVDAVDAIEKSEYLEMLNAERRSMQNRIVKEASLQAEVYKDDPVLVVSNPNWSHGVVGIAASKLMEKYKKPVFVLQEMGDVSKGSARSYGDFSAAEAVKAGSDVVLKGGGHDLAAGVSLLTSDIKVFRKCVNDLYRIMSLVDQDKLLLPTADVRACFNEIDLGELDLINRLEPFGNGNPQPIIRTDELVVCNVRTMGDDSQHIKLSLVDSNGEQMDFLAFNAPNHFFVEKGCRVDVWYYLDVNVWRDKVSIEGKLLHLECRN